MHNYICSSCGKESGVAFRVDVRKPDVISRATPNTVKPYCLSCAEERQREIVAAAARESVQPEQKKSRGRPPGPKQEFVPALDDMQPKSSLPRQLDGNDVEVIWRWAAYGKHWTRSKPSVTGHFWVWSSGVVQEPMLVHLSAGCSLPSTFHGEELWFLGPCKSPPPPPEAILQSKSSKKIGV